MSAPFAPAWSARTVAPATLAVRSVHVSPLQPISTGESGGPTACDSAEALSEHVTVEPSRDLKELLARPSQKFSLLKIALTAEGAWRPVTWTFGGRKNCGV